MRVLVVSYSPVADPLGTVVGTENVVGVVVSIVGVFSVGLRVSLAKPVVVKVGAAVGFGEGVDVVPVGLRVFT